MTRHPVFICLRDENESFSLSLCVCVLCVRMWECVCCELRGRVQASLFAAILLFFYDCCLAVCLLAFNQPPPLLPSPMRERDCGV